MRSLLIIATAILLLPASFALQIQDTGATGINPIIYERYVVFLTFEDDIDEDLNNDGDMSDKVVQYYNRKTRKIKSTGVEGVNYAIFGNRLIIENRAGLLFHYDLSGDEVNALNVRGKKPSIYGDLVAFETHEEDMSLDLTGDGDSEDILIRYLFLGDTSAHNTGAEGINPIALSGRVAFTTDESWTAQDLNKDQDWNDELVRFYDVAIKKLVNTPVQGTVEAGFADPVIVISRRDKLFIVDILSTETQEISEGNSPSVYKGNVVFTDVGMLFSYRVNSESLVEVGFAAEHPSLYDDVVAFADGDAIKLAIGEDPDNDGVSDLFDNCPDVANADQKDEDKNRVGDACEVAETEPVVVTGSAVEETERKPLPDTLVLRRETKNDGGAAYWFLIAVGLTSIGILSYMFVPRWINRRRKGFGF